MQLEKSRFSHDEAHINFGLFGMYATTYRIFWIIFLLHLVIIIQTNSNCWDSVGYKLCSSCSRFVLYFERDFMTSLTGNHYYIIEAFNSTSRYLDDLLNIDNP